jgi:hypothetical protein
MLRGYRGIILAVGLILAGTNHANAEGGDQQKQATQSAAQSLSEIAATNREQAERTKRSDQEEAPCGQGKYDSDADLCAQWKAADAASDSAWWAWAAGIAGVVSTVGVITALGIGLHSNWIARDTAKRQLRAYISIEPGGIEASKGGLSRVPFNIINNGQTPAYELEHVGDFVIVEGSPMEFAPSESGRPDGQAAITDQSLGPNSNRFSYAYLEANLCAPFMDKIAAKEAAIIHYGHMTYMDVFGDRHRTSFAFYHWGEKLSDLESKRCRFGNDAT